MSEAKLEEVKVRTLGRSGHRIFLIPSYQRGYRWSPQNVKELLDDLLSFYKEWTKDHSLKYCLQPIVLQWTGSGERIVDGQQRITTISLILYVLKIDFSWDLIYEEMNVTLKDLLKRGGDSSINWHFMRGVMTATRTWLETNKNCEVAIRSVLSPSLETGEKEVEKESGGVFFIQYYIPDLNEPGSDKKAHETFDELNDGRTPLTSSELIKACFQVYDNGLPHEEQLNIAKEWEVMEKTLSDNELWSIWNTDDFDNCPTRMDLIFSVVIGCNMELQLYDKLSIYHEVEKWITQRGGDRGAALSDLWERVLRCYWWMIWCYRDKRIHNLLGWLAWKTKDSVATLYREVWLGKAKSKSQLFYECLRRRIVDEKFKDRSHDLTQYNYETTKDELPYVLSLINILRANAQMQTLSFDLIRNRNGGTWEWHIEHINSQTENRLTDEQDRFEWMKMAEEELLPDERAEFNNLSAFEDRWSYVQSRFAPFDEKYKLKDEHCVGNLTMLDSTTNEKYKNAILPKKRRMIFEVASKISEWKRPILPCTMMAFSKMESCSAAQMRFWSRTDAESFQSAQQKLLDDFFEIGR